MNIAEVRKVVGKLKQNFFKKANSNSLGILKTSYKGTGLQFKDHQVYNFGDDVRFIDWKILAKTSNPYIKTFEEERNVEIFVFVDVNPTMFYGLDGVSKLQAIIEMTCMLYLLAKESNDFVHTVILAKEIKTLPKMSGEIGVSRFLSELQKVSLLDSNLKIISQNKNEFFVDNSKKYLEILKILKSKKELIIFSDFNDLFTPLEQKQVSSKPNVKCIQVISPLDEAANVPYSILNFQNKLLSFKFNNSNKENQKNNKKLKKVLLGENYLERFVMELK